MLEAKTQFSALLLD